MPIGMIKKGRNDQNQSSDSGDCSFTNVNYPLFISLMGRINEHMSNNEVVLPKILKGLMDQQKISLRKLSKELSIPQSTLSNYLSGRRKTYEPNILSKLSRHFNCSLEFLLFGEMHLEEMRGVKSRPLFQKIVKLTLEDVFFDESIIKGEK